MKQDRKGRNEGKMPSIRGLSTGPVRQCYPQSVVSSRLNPVYDTDWRFQFADARFCSGDRQVAPTIATTAGLEVDFAW